MGQASEFIKEYNALLDQLSVQNPTRLFWSTDFASKNRFSCPLPDMLEQLVAQGQMTRLQPDVRFKRFLGIFYHAFKIGGRMLKARSCLKALTRGKEYIVVKTFIYNHSFDDQGHYKDVFWGKFLEEIKDQENILILGTILGDYNHCLSKITACKSFTIVPMEAFLSMWDLWQACWEQLTVPIRIPNRLYFKGQEIASIVRDCFDRTFKGVQLVQFVQYWVAERLARTIAIKKFYMTCENYPWERMMIMALRKVDPKIPIIGYQHTVVPEAFLNYFASQAEVQAQLWPDRILTTGQRTKDIIQKYSSKGIHVQTSCALRFEYLHTISLSPRRKIRHILLALEGSWIAEPMVKSVFQQMAGSESFTLRIRTHPILPWEALGARLSLKSLDFQNIEISRGSLTEDLQWADAVVYHSTAVSMEALMMGKPVVHVDMKSVLSFDPLLECQALKKNIRLDESLLETFKEIDALSDEQFLSQQKNARAYLESYFYPVKMRSLEVFLN